MVKGVLVCEPEIVPKRLVGDQEDSMRGRTGNQ